MSTALRAIEHLVAKMPEVLLESSETQVRFAEELQAFVRANKDFRNAERITEQWASILHAFRAREASDPQKVLPETKAAYQEIVNGANVVRVALVAEMKPLYAALQSQPLCQSVDEVYHGTHTGPDNAQLIAFFSKGVSVHIDPHIRRQNTATGQQSGFYVWRSVDLAQNHALQWVHTRVVEYPVVLALPYIPSLQWGIDLEVNSARASIFVAAHLDELRAIPDGVLAIDGTSILTSALKLGKYKIEVKTNTGRLLGVSFSNDISIGDAAVLSVLYEGLRAAQPSLVFAFERSLLADPKFCKAAVYRGSSPLPVLRAEVFIEGKWIDGRAYLIHPALW